MLLSLQFQLLFNFDRNLVPQTLQILIEQDDGLISLLVVVLLQRSYLSQLVDEVLLILTQLILMFRLHSLHFLFPIVDDLEGLTINPLSEVLLGLKQLLLMLQLSLLQSLFEVVLILQH